jgi:integrase
VFLTRIQHTRIAPVVTICVALSLRVGEVLGLQWSAVDLEQGTLRVEQALETIGRDRTLVDVKSKESHRTVRIPDIVRTALVEQRRRQRERQLLAGQEWRPEGSSFVFTTGTGRPLDGGNLTRDLKRLLEQTWVGGDVTCKYVRAVNRQCATCGAEQLPRMSFQSLRHSCASILLAQGVPLRDVSEILGHSDVRLTLSTYAHVLKGSRDRAAGVMDRAIQVGQA